MVSGAFLFAQNKERQETTGIILAKIPDSSTGLPSTVTGEIPGDWQKFLSQNAAGNRLLRNCLNCVGGELRRVV